MKPMHMFSALALYLGLSFGTYDGNITPPKAKAGSG